MKTIIHIETTDEERVAIGKGKPVTRKDITEMVNEFIQEKINGSGQQEHTKGGEVRPEAGRERQRGDDSSPPKFIPSRGDEDYLAQPKDAELAAACSRILDDTTLIQNYAWDTVERNRKK